ncbi:SpdD-like protein [Streptomyces sp. NPDC087300]|uniref:SpdD-like protein n=1 Tax=Streptomyces sp. NPDC087300 TaxID=3365780 RepID=UPI0038115910
MFTPKVPANEMPTGEIIPIIATAAHGHPQAPVACHCHHQAPAPAPPSRPAVRVTPATVLTGAAVVLVVGAVLVSMLLAVAITAGSLAVVALVVRSLMNNEAKRR